ncbi:spore coat protein GerQ [Virgibacillus kekensis]|uniref:Spore coat protein GerQ n=1 Tax=Virgibacillus kekensis TaxID=202261 RepID=A0ABV9DK31_9BACI
MSDKNSNSSEQNHPYTNPYQATPYYYYPQASPAYYPAYEPRQFPDYQQPATPAPEAAEQMLPMEQSYIENILRLNEGKMATVYMSFENESDWSSKVFRGIIEAAGRDHIILSDPNTGRRYLLLMIYLDYVTFEGEINYSYPYGNQQQMSQYPPR